VDGRAQAPLTGFAAFGGPLSPIPEAVSLACTAGLESETTKEDSPRQSEMVARCLHPNGQRIVSTQFSHHRILSASHKRNDIRHGPRHSSERVWVPAGDPLPVRIQEAALGSLEVAATGSAYGHNDRSEPLAGVGRWPSAVPNIDPRAGVMGKFVDDCFSGPCETE
jgi:hypothetical protein